MRSILRVLLRVGTFITLSVGLEAQQRNAGASSPTELDIAITYSAQRNNLSGGGDFWQLGGSMEVAAMVYNGLGLAMNIAGTHASGISTSGVDLTPSRQPSDHATPGCIRFIPENSGDSPFSDRR